MTTTVIVKTHTWPVCVTISDSYNFDSDTLVRYGHSMEKQFVAAHSERSFHVTNTRSISVAELPENAMGINDGVLGCIQAQYASNVQ